MAYEKKRGDLAVFKNTRKVEGDNKPHYEISGLGLDGLPIKGALWLKEDRNGKKFMAGKIEVDTYLMEKNPQDFPNASSGSVARGGGGGDNQESGQRDLRSAANPFDDGIPFVRW